MILCVCHALRKSPTLPGIVVFAQAGIKAIGGLQPVHNLQKLFHERVVHNPIPYYFPLYYCEGITLET